MEEILSHHNPHWGGAPYAGLFPRAVEDRLWRQLRLPSIQVVLGVRRSGKSTLFRLLINRLMEKHDPRSLLYCNLDDPALVGLGREPGFFYRLRESAEKLTGVPPRYLLLDEAQSLAGWERAVKAAYDNRLFAKIMVTGSNASLLAGDYARLLSGRYVATHLYPLSFAELLAARGLAGRLDTARHRARLLALAERAVAMGLFPEVVKTDDASSQRELLASYYDTILLKDCIAGHSVREVRALRDLAHYLITNVSSLYSYNSLARAVGGNENTCREFAGLLEDSFLIREVRHFAYSLGAQSKARRKCYCLDNGLVRVASFSFSENRGKLLENLVFTELVKMDCGDIFYHQGRHECDFIVKQGRRLAAIQVTCRLEPSNRERELAGLQEAQSALNIKRAAVVTFDQRNDADPRHPVILFWELGSWLGQ
ncbi:MAG: ATP-binding protein [Candidatus Edwardsbacteria bacterium]|nr:ATP-binding protein [Candidatus Edwardsbacteria bacterium]